MSLPHATLSCAHANKHSHVAAQPCVAASSSGGLSPWCAELPPWCTDAAAFVAYHREMLESPEVSARLHHWIDLTFGCRLAGEEAVSSRNVPLVQPTPPGHLHRVRDRSTFRQVFELPHPQRLVDAQPHLDAGVVAEVHPGPVDVVDCKAAAHTGLQAPEVTMGGLGRPWPIAAPTAEVPPHAVLHGPESSWSYSLSRGLVFGCAPQVSLAVPGAALAHRAGCGPLMAHKRLALGLCAEDEISLFVQRHDALVDPGYGPAGWELQDNAGPVGLCAANLNTGPIVSADSVGVRVRASVCSCVCACVRTQLCVCICCHGMVLWHGHSCVELSKVWLALA